jgi:carbon storage regulator
MLVLTRKLKESVVIDNDIEVTVLDIRGDHVRLGIKAPKNFRIFRSEIYDAVREANISSTGVSDNKLAELSKKMKMKAKTEKE